MIPLRFSQSSPSSPKSCPPPASATFYVALVVIIATCSWLLARMALKLAVPFPDTRTYLEAGRNLLEGRGFITTYNIVYGWSNTLSHPALAYYNPLGAIWLGAVWELFPDFARFAAAVAVVPCAANAFLLAILVRQSAGTTAALLTAVAYFLLPSTMSTATTVGLEGPMVTVCLLLVLLLRDRDEKESWPWVVAGMLVGVGYLVKVTVLAANAAVVVGVVATRNGTIQARLRSSLRPITLFFAGALIIIVPYQAACLWSAGSLYPEYPRMAKLWGTGKLYGGKFADALPLVRPDLDRLPGLGQCLSNVISNLMYSAAALVRDLSLFCLPILAIPLVWRQLTQTEKYLLLLGGTFFSVYVTAFYWYPFSVDPFSLCRYILHTSAFWVPVSVMVLSRLASRFSKRTATATVVAVILAAVCLVPSLAISRNLYLKAGEIDQPRHATLQSALAVCNKLTSPSDLVAVMGGSPMICGSLFIDRPLVAIPEDQMATPENILAFLDIYRPKLVVASFGPEFEPAMLAMHYKPVQAPTFQRAFGNGELYFRDSEASPVAASRSR